MSNSVRPHRRQRTRLPRPWDSPGKNTGVGCHFLLQGIFPIQGSNLGLMHCKQILYHLNQQENPSGAAAAAAAAAKLLQLCPTLCDPIDGCPPGSRPWDSPGKNTGVGCHFLPQCMKVKREREVTQSYPTLGAYQASPSMGFSRQEY